VDYSLFFDYFGALPKRYLRNHSFFRLFILFYLSLEI
jgi:hypothetical protein